MDLGKKTAMTDGEKCGDSDGNGGQDLLGNKILVWKFFLFFSVRSKQCVNSI